MVQYWSALTQSTSPFVHADALYLGGERRNPSYLVRGEFNRWGLDAGLTMNLENSKNLDDGWTLAVSGSTSITLIPFQLMTRWPASIQLNVFGYDDYFYGDPRGDELAQRLPPNALSGSSVSSPLIS
jgi:alpha-1,3-glucan synthase